MLIVALVTLSLTVIILVVTLTWHSRGYADKIDFLYKEFPKFKTALVRLLGALGQKEILGDLVSAGSPLHLTPAGEQMLKESGFYKFFETNRDYLVGEVKKFNPKTRFDVEESAKKVMVELPEDRPDFEPIKEYAYKKGRQISGMLFAYAIYLRDQVIEELNLPSVEPTPKSD